MSNKTQLQQNNIELQEHLQDILALPNVNDVKNGQYVWKELTAEGGDFRKYVVSDNESAYPDGGEKDGFWYERVVEGVAGVDFGTVTMASNKSSVTVEHNLGVVPKYAVIVLITSWYLRYANMVVLAGSSGFLADHSTSSPTVHGSSDKKTYSANENTITFNNASSSSNYIKPKEYLWFAIA